MERLAQLFGYISLGTLRTLQKGYFLFQHLVTLVTTQHFSTYQHVCIRFKGTYRT